jgi:transcription antitermination factor NusG
MEQGHLNEVRSEKLAVSSPHSAVRSMQSAVLSQQSADCQFKSPLGDLGAKGQYASAVNPWLVIKTKTKCEKFVRDKIRAMGMEAFVPLKKRTAKYNRKVKVYELPLISCYTFVRLDKDRRNQVLSLPYVMGFLRMNGKDCLVSDHEMQWLHKVSGIDQEVTTETLSIQEGDQVMIAYGHLAGMEGKIVTRRSKHEVVVALESLGLQMVLHVDPAMLVRQ